VKKGNAALSYAKVVSTRVCVAKWPCIVHELKALYASSHSVSSVVDFGRVISHKDISLGSSSMDAFWLQLTTWRRVTSVHFLSEHFLDSSGV